MRTQKAQKFQFCHVDATFGSVLFRCSSTVDYASRQEEKRNQKTIHKQTTTRTIPRKHKKTHSRHHLPFSTPLGDEWASKTAKLDGESGFQVISPLVLSVIE
ncbi:hypothetical protein CPB86DRAFT_315498 [Serendipita vermifera]|nr:hypothetical protein CPB86DRAFT_315498 [Serendipita vermifera]